MNFGELCSEVMVLTNRLDLVAETQLHVRAATLRLHAIDTWFKDLNERQLNYGSSGYAFQADTQSQFTNFRSFKYIRKFDQAGNLPGGYLSKADPAALHDEFGRDKLDIYYVAGTNLNIKTADAQSSFLVGWYSYPNVTNAYNSWMAEQFPYAIIEEAAGRLLHIIGMVEEGNKFVDPRTGSVALIHIPLLRANCLSEAQ